MSDIGQLMALQQRINEQEREDIRNIGRTVGDIFAQRGQRSFEKNAIDFFTREGVSPQAINRFQSMYPHVPATLIYHWAGEIGKQQEAQDMEDMFASFQSAVANIKDPSELTPELIARVVKNPAYLPKFVEVFKAYKDLYPDVKWLPLGEGEQQFQTIGGKPTGEVISGKERANVSIFDAKTGVSKKVTRTEADKLIDTGKWTEGKPGKLEDRYEPFGHGQMWDKKTGKIIKVPTSGIGRSTGRSTEKRVAYRDTVTGAIHYYNVNNPKDRETLTKFGAQLMPVSQQNKKSATERLEDLVGMRGKFGKKLVPPAGYKLSTKTVKGKPVYISPDGKHAWIAP